MIEQDLRDLRTLVNVLNDRSIEMHTTLQQLVAQVGVQNGRVSKLEIANAVRDKEDAFDDGEKAGRVSVARISYYAMGLAVAIGGVIAAVAGNHSF
jgi:hypothetical protein